MKKLVIFGLVALSVSACGGRETAESRAESAQSRLQVMSCSDLARNAFTLEKGLKEQKPFVDAINAAQTASALLAVVGGGGTVTAGSEVRNEFRANRFEFEQHIVAMETKQCSQDTTGFRTSLVEFGG